MLHPAVKLTVTLGALALLSAPSQALAWGATGHRMIAEVGVQALPTSVPAFLRTPQTVLAIGELSREPDRSKGSGKLHSSMREPNHFVDIDDQGLIEGTVPFEPLAATRGDYELSLRSSSLTTVKGGLLAYAIVDGWQQLTKDFAYWRALTAAIPRSRSASERAWMKADLARREALILRDLGDWSHFVADGSQPLHVTNHYNGWGDGPNPNGYTTLRTLHGRFEGALVQQVADPARVAAAVGPYAACNCTIEQATVTYLKTTNAQVEPLYRLEKDGALVAGDARGRDFIEARLSHGAATLRNMIVEAWTASAISMVGWPAVSVADVESGKVDPYRALYGAD